jgi:hypothetical protein
MERGLRPLLRPVHVDALCLVMLLLLLAALFAPVLLGGETFYHRDLLFNHLPRKLATLAVLREGSLPLWNPYLDLGEPLLANPNNTVLHPSTLLFLVLPPFVALSLAVAGQLLLAAASTYLLLRRWGVRPVAALVAAVGLGLSGPLLSLGSFLNAVSSAAPAPLALLAADLAARERRSVWPLLLGAVWALQAAGGEPVVALATAALSAGYLLVMAAGGSWRERLGAGLGSLLAAAAWAAGLAALQLLPTLELLGSSGRGQGLGLEQVGAWSLDPRSLLEVAVPGLFGDPTVPGTPGYWGEALHHRGLPYLLSLGVGTPLLVLAAVGAQAPGRRHRYLLGAGLVSLVGALGRHTPLLALTVALAPWTAAARFPVKLFFVTDLCIAALAGLGLEALLTGQPRRALRPVLVAVGAALALVLVAAWVVPDPPDPSRLVRPLLVAGFGLAGTLALVMRLARRRDREVWPLWALVGLTALALLPAHRRLNPTAPVEVWTRPEAVRVLEREGDLQRIQRRSSPVDPRAAAAPDPLPRHLLAWSSLHPNAGIAFGLAYGLNATSDGLDWPAARRLGAFAESLPYDLRWRLLGLARISHLLAFEPLPGLEPVAELEVGADRPLLVLGNPLALPRAVVVGAARREDDLEQACRELARDGFDPRRTVVLSGVDPGAGLSSASSTPHVVSATANRVELETGADGPGWLVLLDSFSPGWRATVDEQPVAIARADVAFRAVPIAAGSHRVVFRYRPRSVAVGVLASGLSLVLAAAVLLASFRRRSAARPVHRASSAPCSASSSASTERWQRRGSAQ